MFKFYQSYLYFYFFNKNYKIKLRFQLIKIVNKIFFKYLKICQTLIPKTVILVNYSPKNITKNNKKTRNKFQKV